MKIIACVDDKMGLMFHNRRQSKDRKVREDMLMLVPGNLWVSPYTARQFEEEEQERLLVAEDFLQKAGEGEYCFIEDADVLPYADCIEEVVLYHWNRVYPADTFFNLPLTPLEHVERTNLTGHSHPDIVREIYRKKKEGVESYEE